MLEPYTVTMSIPDYLVTVFSYLPTQASLSLFPYFDDHFCFSHIFLWGGGSWIPYFLTYHWFSDSFSRTHSAPAPVSGLVGLPPQQVHMIKTMTTGTLIGEGSKDRDYWGKWPRVRDWIKVSWSVGGGIPNQVLVMPAGVLFSEGYWVLR